MTEFGARITIIGASVRAAAASALRAGLLPWCVDLFADSDLRRLTPDVRRVPFDRYPHAFLNLLREAPDCPWMYTGGLENYPELIRQMAEIRPLWGNDDRALRICRDPKAMASMLRDEGIQVPEVRTSDADSLLNQRWLRKPFAGSAGQGIAFAEPALPQRVATHYLQQFVEGPSMSAVYVRARGDVQLIGVSEQLVGTDWLNAKPFHYAGNVGPIAPVDQLRSQLLRIGRVVGERCGLLGLFGVDFVLNDNRPWVVEVNPRYPASVEVHELATGVSAIQLHRTAFDPFAADTTGCVIEDWPAGSARASCTRPVVGKGILYARKQISVCEEIGSVAPQQCYSPQSPFGPHHEACNSVSWKCGDNSKFARVIFADIPRPGELIEAGWPVLTLLAKAETPEGCRHCLFEAATLVDQRLFGSSNEPTQVA